MELHTGSPLFAGVDSHDQLFKIVRVLGSFPGYLIEMAQKRDKYFEKIGRAGMYAVKTPPTHASSEQGFILDLSPPRGLRTIIGVETGGPSGRRSGESGHSRNDYEQFFEFVRAMLELDPSGRIGPKDALLHPFLQRALNTENNDRLSTQKT